MEGMKFRKGQSPPSHRIGCKCFRCTGKIAVHQKGCVCWRCTKIPPNINGWDQKEKEKISESLKGNKRREGKYKYTKITYSGLHRWVTKRIKKPVVCPQCGSNKRLELTNSNHEYQMVLKDWGWLCHKCHMIIDGKMRKKGFSKKKEYELVLK